MFDAVWQPMVAYLSAMQGGAWPPVPLYTLLAIIVAIAGLAELPSVVELGKLRQSAVATIIVSFLLAFVHILLFLVVTLVMTLIKDGQFHLYVALHFVALCVAGLAAFLVYSPIARQHTKAALAAAQKKKGFG